MRSVLVAGVGVCAVILVLLGLLLRSRNRRNRALAEMNATKDKFFSIISHDLKNPAIAQRDALKLLADNTRMWNVEQLAAYHSELLKSAEGQVELVYGLLGWSQLQTGRVAFTPHPFLLNELHGGLSLIRKMAENKGITFVSELPEDALVTGDSNMLATVVRNLLTNAVKFTAAGGQVTLTISPYTGNSPTVHRAPCTAYRISVSDTGTGMSAAQLRNLVQLDSRHSRLGTADEQGSGLGLIVCKELLEKHSSTLHVESKIGKGTRFWFTIME
jgi:signal transduction histidine kinase